MLYCNAWLFALLSPSSTSLVLLWPLSLTKYFCPQNCCSLDVFLFFSAPFSANSRPCYVWESPEISSFWDTQTPLRHQQSFHSQTYFDHISFPFWHLVWKTAEPVECLNAFKNLGATTWLAYEIFALTSWSPGPPPKVFSECIYINTYSVLQNNWHQSHFYIRGIWGSPPPTDGAVVQDAPTI